MVWVSSWSSPAFGVTVALATIFSTLLLWRLLIAPQYYRGVDRGALLLQQRLKKLVAGRLAASGAAAIAVVTGGGTGIGLEIARKLSRAGMHVVLVGRRADVLLEAAKLCRADGASSVETVACDVTVASDCERLAAAVKRFCDALQASKGHRGSEACRVDLLVLNAGAGAIQPFVGGAPLQEFLETAHQLMELNFFANVRLLGLLLPHAIGSAAASSPARVLVVSSLAGVLPSTLRSSYTASKHAVHGFVNALRGEFAPGQVTFTLGCPGYVDTTFHATAAAIGGGGGAATTFNAAPHRHGSMSAEECALKCLSAAVDGAHEAVMTTSGIAGYRLRPWLPGLVDALAAKKSFASLGLKAPS